VTAAICLLFMLPAAGRAEPPAGGTHAAPASAAAAAPWRFRLGPFLEVGRNRDGLELLAVRPLFCRASDSRRAESVTDLLWPWSSWHRRGAFLDGWFFPAFYLDEDVRAPFGRYSFWLLPVYAEGRTRAGEEFGALFPLGGTLRDFLWLDELHFAVFPLHLGCRQGAQQTESYLWPIYLRETGPKRERFRLFPVYGTSTTATQRASFAFWPFWTQQVFDGPKQHGTAEMLFPVYGRVDTDTQQGWMVLPPFFSRLTLTNGETRLRAPWPVYETARTQEASRDNCWPLWTHTETATGQRGTIAWPLWWEETIATRARQEEHRTLVPFYHAVHRTVTGAAPAAVTLDYVRVWPCYSRYARPEGTRIRVPELTWMRDGEGIERNWAPFWSWYVQHEQPDGACDHDLFWGLARWGRQCDDTTYFQCGPLAAWQQRADGSVSWQVLGGLFARTGGGGGGRNHWFWSAPDPAPEGGSASSP
jgi:hypothetical protein